LHFQLHKPHMAISQPHTLTPQSSVAVTHYILIAPHFTFPKGMEARVEIVCLLSAHVREHVSLHLTLQPTELARQSGIVRNIYFELTKNCQGQGAQIPVLYTPETGVRCHVQKSCNNERLAPGYVATKYEPDRPVNNRDISISPISPNISQKNFGTGCRTPKWVPPSTPQTSLRISLRRTVLKILAKTRGYMPCPEIV